MIKSVRVNESRPGSLLESPEQKINRLSEEMKSRRKSLQQSDFSQSEDFIRLR
jgi:hypothetical protein